MRRSAFLDTAEELGPHAHVCWAFDQPAEFRARAGRFLADGLAAGELVIYVDGSATTWPDEELGREFQAARDAGRARVMSLGELYPAGTTVHPEAQAALFADTVEDALARGFAGLRVAADVTALVETAPQRDAFSRYEHLVDRQIAGAPLSGMCGIQRPALGAAAAAELACLHPLASVDSTTFLLYPAGDPAVSLVLSGELDLNTQAVLSSALRRIELPAIDGAVVIDAVGLTFVDHRALYEIVSVITDRGSTVVMQAKGEGVLSTLANLLCLPGLRVQVS
jgi:hypothetical protein